MTHASAYQIKFTWGKHTGISIGLVNDTDPGYLEWIARTHGIPDAWRTAASLTLRGESISHLGLSSKEATTGTKLPKATLRWQKRDTISVSFPYDKELVSRFKLEIDGCRWDKDGRHWLVSVVHLPKIVKLFGKENLDADEKVKESYRTELARRASLDEIRVKGDTDFSVNTLVELFPYQKVGVEFIVRAGGRALVADSMGLGKTATAIGYAVHGKFKTLIVCPKSVKIGWEREIARFAGKNACIWDSKTKKGRIDAQFHIINYEIVAKRFEDLRELEFDLLVCDEATKLKNRQTLMAKAIFGDWKNRKTYPGIKTKHAVFLTGTPVLNRPIEAFTLLNFLDNKRFNNFYQFVQKYGGWRGEKERNLEDLHERTKDLIIRRTKAEVLPELPAKQRNDLYVELSAAEHKEYNLMLSRVFSKWKDSGKPSVAEMPAIQRFLGEKKIPRAIEMIDELLENDRPILVFSCFLDPLHKLKKLYGDKAAVIDGSMNAAQRQVTIDALKHGTAKVGLFSITAAGMGIDGLQHQIDTVLFLDQAWVPAIHEQAEDRCHRIGQKGQVQVFYMICEGTIDEYMREILAEKQKVIDTIVDGRLITEAREKSFFKQFVKRLTAATLAKVGDIDATEEISENVYL